MEDYTLDRDAAIRLGKVVRRVERMGGKLDVSKGVNGVSPARVGLVRWTGDPFITETISGLSTTLYPGIQVAWNAAYPAKDYPPFNPTPTAPPPGYAKTAPPIGGLQYTNAGQPSEPTNDCWIRVNPDIPFLKKNVNKNQWYVGVSSASRQTDGLPIFAIDQVWPIAMVTGGTLTSGSPITWTPPAPDCPHTLYTFTVPAGSPSSGGGATISGIGFPDGYQAGRIITLVNNSGGDLWINGQVATGGVNTTIYLPARYIPNDGSGTVYTVPVLKLKQSDAATFWTDGTTGWYLVSTTFTPDLLIWRQEYSIPAINLTPSSPTGTSGGSLTLPYVGYYFLTAQLNGTITETPPAGNQEWFLNANLVAGGGGTIGNAATIAATVAYSPGGGVLLPSLGGTGTISVLYQTTTPNQTVGVSASYGPALAGGSASLTGTIDAVYLSPGALTLVTTGFSGTL